MLFAVAVIGIALLALWGGWELSSSASKAACSKAGGTWAHNSGVCMEARWSAIEEPQPPSCETVVDGKQVFLGSIECMRSLPKKEIHGFWVSGYESSAFFPTYSEAGLSGISCVAGGLNITPPWL
ncbi:hypothetical protein [Altericroceibacterium xinjiangense]|uniref:hypothetical protein n=1 Tax=Altericroceibacterium xinjiangense TaxID=762261 RepID=UPI000F7EEDB1|nr:hypothetical protein [Altericroceibacterium xinjiangense]